MTAAAAVLVLVTVLARRLEGTWFAPGPVFAAYWAVWIAATAVWGHDYSTPTVGLVFLVAAVVALAAGSYAGGPTRPEASGPAVRIRRPELIVLASLVGGVAGVAATLATLHHGGLTAGSIGSTQGLLEAGNQISVSRYSGDQGPAVVPWLLGVCYAASLVAPCLLAQGGRRIALRSRLVVVVPALAVGLYSTVSTARLPLLLACSFTATSGVVAWSIGRGTFPRLRSRHLFAGLAAAGLVALAFVLIAFVRVGTGQAGVRPVIFSNLKVYALGGVPAFAQWLDDPVPGGAPGHPLALGQSTFGAAARQLGFDPALSQAYTDPRQVQPDSGAGTNIFTAFRALVTDFGLAGALLFLGILGFVMARLQRLLLGGRAQVAAAPLLSAGYVYLLNTNSQSIFWFTNVWLALVLAIVVLAWATREPHPDRHEVRTLAARARPVSKPRHLSNVAPVTRS